MNWQEFIETLMRDFRLSSIELEQKTGVSNAVISQLKTGKTKKPNQYTIRKLEEGLNIRIDDSDPNNITYKKIQPIPFEGAIPAREYPLLSEVYAGEPDKFDIELYDEKEYFAYKYPSHRCFALRVNGHSMETTLKDGDVVLVDMDSPPVPGDIVAVKLKNGNQYIKRYYPINEYFIKLSSDNPDYDVRLIDTKDIVAIHPVVAINLYTRNFSRRG